MPSIPSPWTASDAAAWAKRPAASGSPPRAYLYVKAAAKTSPAPVGSSLGDELRRRREGAVGVPDRVAATASREDDHAHLLLPAADGIGICNVFLRYEYKLTGKPGRFYLEIDRADLTVVEAAQPALGTEGNQGLPSRDLGWQGFVDLVEDRRKEDDRCVAPLGRDVVVTNRACPAGDTLMRACPRCRRSRRSWSRVSSRRSIRLAAGRDARSPRRGP